jgi:hypothetical protein
MTNSVAGIKNNHFSPEILIQLDYWSEISAYTHQQIGYKLDTNLIQNLGLIEIFVNTYGTIWGN